MPVSYLQKNRPEPYHLRIWLAYKLFIFQGLENSSIIQGEKSQYPGFLISENMREIRIIGASIQYPLIFHD